MALPSQDFELPPKPAPWFVAWFCEISRRKMKKRFHQVRITKASVSNLSELETGPVVAFANHSSWWDPLISMILKARFFPHQTGYTPIDAVMLERYGIFRKLGYIGIDRESKTSASRQFLRISEAILQQPNSMIWLTPQGRFVDARERPLTFERGIAHLAKRVPETRFLPLAIEYPFWEESRPEALIHLGKPMVPDSTLNFKELTSEFETALEEAQDFLAERAISRDPNEFEPMIQGSAGVGGFYDTWRRFRLLVQGRKPDELKHSNL
ncbi:MAG: lysophospholipid acyltransferase family protein [Verrucomicrobiota bacterium]